MDPTLTRYKLAAPCGCYEISTYNDDPEFEGYDTDREEIEFKMCKNHRDKVKRLKEQSDELYQIYEIKSDELEQLKKSIMSSLIIQEKEPSKHKVK